MWLMNWFSSSAMIDHPNLWLLVLTLLFPAPVAPRTLLLCHVVSLICLYDASGRGLLRNELDVIVCGNDLGGHDGFV
jgi:hypothetical protein